MPFRYVERIFGMRYLILLSGLFGLAASLVGCSEAAPPPAQPVAPVTNEEVHNRYYQEASALVRPYLHVSDKPARPWDNAQGRGDLRRGIALYAAVVSYAPTNWSAYWFMGKSYQTLGEATNACDAFASAFALQRRNPDVGREYMFECLEIGRMTDAIRAAEHASYLKPRDAGLLANLALAYTMAGQISEATAAVDKSLAIDPADKIPLNLKRVIGEIAAGKRPQPRTLAELEK